MAVAAPQLVAHVAQLCRAICRAFRTRKTAHNLKQGAGGARTSDTHAPGSRGTYCVVGVGGPQQRGRPETMCKPPWCPDTSTGGTTCFTPSAKTCETARARQQRAAQSNEPPEQSQLTGAWREVPRGRPGPRGQGASRWAWWCVCNGGQSAHLDPAAHSERF